jgi:hypothetical protein
MTRLAAFAMVAGFLVVAGSIWLANAETATKILLVSPDDRSDAQLRATIAGFRGAGYYVTEHPKSA